VVKEFDHKVPVLEFGKEIKIDGWKKQLEVE
jgi:hypothetical protein